MSQAHTTSHTTPEGAGSLMAQPATSPVVTTGDGHQTSDGRDETFSSDSNITVRESDTERKKREAKEKKSTTSTLPTL